MITVVTVDKRRPITAFGLLDWAYRKECVRAAGEEEWAQIGEMRQSVLAKAGEQLTRGTRRGTINGKLDVHIDALFVDKFCYDNCTSELYYHLTINAERGKPVPAAIALPPLQCGPKYHDPFSNRLVMIYDAVSKRATACAVEWQGLAPEEIGLRQERHAMVYRGFVALLHALPELKLEMWRVEGLGA